MSRLIHNTSNKYRANLKWIQWIMFKTLTVGFYIYLFPLNQPKGK